jgi:HPr kinase/phosphorylase
MLFRVRDLLAKTSHELQLSLEAGAAGLSRRIRVPEAQRPGLSLAGYLKSQASSRILVIGKVEMEYLRDLEVNLRKERLQALLQASVPAVIVTRRYRPPRELLELCEQAGVPLLRTPLPTMEFLSKLTIFLHDQFAPQVTLHATLVEVFGIGVLLQGDSAVGKSETALGLIERGHRLISDDVVTIHKKEGRWLEGTGPELTRHLIEIRGIGILNVAHLYGAVCVCSAKSIDLVATLEPWDEKRFYNRVGDEDPTCEILGVKVPSHVLPVKPGRDVVLLIETLALNHRLKAMGYNSARELNQRLLEQIALRQKSRNGTPSIRIS